MPISSNQYANKVYSEHPIALWPLDEKAYYLSLIDNNDRQFTNWTNNGTDRVNFVTNPSFETNTTGWSLQGTGTTIARTTTDKLYGSASLEITKAAVANSGASTAASIMIAGQTYSFSVYVKVPATNATGDFYISATWRNSSATTISTNSSTPINVSSSDGWVRLTLTATAPANSYDVVFFVRQFTSGTAGQKFLIDGVMLEQSSSIGSYFDGSINGGAWTGTANDSPSVIHIKNRSNLILNPSIETNTTYWAALGSSTISQYTTDAVFGSKSLQVTLANTATTANNVATIQGSGNRIPVVEGKTYIFSLYIKQLSGSASTYRFRMLSYSANSGGTIVQQPIPGTTSISSGGAWTRMIGAVTIPTGAPWLTINIECSSGAASQVILLDAALLEESAVAYPYFDGSTEPTYNGVQYTVALGKMDVGSIGWSGTTHASTSYITQWSATNTPTIPDTPSPFEDSAIYSSITKSNAIAGTVEVQSPDLFSGINTTINDKTFTVNTFLYQNPAYINWFKIGYRYTNVTAQEVISDEIPAPDTLGWININKTFTLPTTYSGSIKIFLQINFSDSSAGDSASRTMVMNGLSVGQGSSLTCYESLGSTAVDLPDEVGYPSITGVPADQYGLVSNNGYYMVDNNALLAHNDAMSMIYGTDNCTKIEPSGTSLPSFIFPGKGMLHESGRSNDYSLEMWIKIDPQNITTKKIVGPLDSIDGIYIKEGFISLSIGDQVGSHYVGEWYRPMLMHLVLKEKNALLMINGEEVINIDYDRATISLPGNKSIDQLSSDPVTGNYEGRTYYNTTSNVVREYINSTWQNSSISILEVTGRNWWGIWSYTGTKFFSIDCIAIYPYIVSSTIAKRRFIYGQGTPSLLSLDNGYAGTPTSIDFATAEYGSSIMYPDTYRWDAGYFNNLTATRDYLAVPDYSLPVINIGGRNLDEWYADNYTVNTLEDPNSNFPKFITFRPNFGFKSVERSFNDSGVTMDDAAINFDGYTAGVEYGWYPEGTNYQEQAYFNFPTLSMLNDRVAAVYGIFEIESAIATERVLMSFSNTANGDRFDIKIINDEVSYYINSTLLYTEVVPQGTGFAVGLNIDTISSEFGYEVSRFFSSPSSIQLYIGGDGTVTFEGKVFLIGLANDNNYEKISSNFYEAGTMGAGFAKQKNYQILTDHLASYTLVPEYEYGKFFLDISIASQWEEFYPLSYFASYVKDSNGNLVYDLDMLQINIGYSSVESTGIWTYQDLKTEFTLPNDYADLAASVYNSSYFSLKKKNTTGSSVNVSNSSLQGYITFQSLADGANLPLSSFDHTKLIDESKIIYADLENTAFLPERVYDTKFAFVDDTIIFPPKTNPFEDYAMVVHLEINQRSILKNPLKVRKMEITSKNFNNNLTNGEIQKTQIGTKFGKYIYPYVQQLAILNGKDKKPFSISKETVPYLYNASKSGIGIRNEAIQTAPPINDTQIFISINDSSALSYVVSAIQLMIKPFFLEGTETVKLFEIVHQGGRTLFSAQKNTTGASIVCYTQSGDTYFIDGGTPSTASYVEVFDGGESSSNYLSTMDINVGVQQQTTTEISYVENTENTYYQNGKYVTNPTLKNNEWSTIGIIPNQSWNFSSFNEGGIILYGGARFNNVSYYLSEGLEIAPQLDERIWQEVLDAQTVGATPWQYWNGSYWQTVYLKSQTYSYVVTPSDIYDAYVGTNGSIIDDGYGVVFDQRQIRSITNAAWSVVSGKPA